MQDAKMKAALLAIANGPVTGLAVAVAAACLGFLPFNLPRARIFLGDAGSGAIGFLLALLLAWGAMGRAASDWVLLLLPASAFLVDAVPYQDGRLLTDGAAAIQQRGAHGHGGAGGCPGRDTVAAHQLS